MALEDDDMLTYAKDVMYAYKNLDNTEMWQANATPSQKSLLDFLGNPQHRMVFFKEMLPKAQEAIIKARNGRDPDEIGIQERRGIADLRSLLKEHLAAADKITV